MTCTPTSLLRDRSAVECLLAPRAIAVVGATERDGALGRAMVANLLGSRIVDHVYPVNPRYRQVLGLPCHPSLAAIGQPVDCVALAVPDGALPGLLDEAAAAGARGVFIPSRCYEPDDAPSPRLVARLGERARAAGIALLGVNCMGFVNYGQRLVVCGNAPPLPESAGGVGFLSHSGSTWSGVAGNQRDLALSYAVSVGAETTTTLSDYGHFLLDQPGIRVIAVVIETVRDPRNFVHLLGRAAEQGVAVVALTLGRSPKGRAFALAHSGAIAGEDAAYEALFHRYGVLRADTLDEMLDIVEMFRTERAPRGQVLGMVTDSGGERQLLCDIAERVGLPIDELPAAARADIESILDPGMHADNPVDAYGDGGFLLGRVLERIAADDDCAAAIAATNLVDGRAYCELSVDAVRTVHAGCKVPVALLGNLHATVSRDGARRLREAGVPVLMGTQTGLVAVRNFLAWHRRHGAGERTAPAAPAAAARWHARIAQAGPMNAGESMAMLADFGVPVAPYALAGNPAEATAIAGKLGFPVALKSARADLVHKTEAGALALDLGDESEVLAQAERLLARFGAPLLVQRQLEGAVEVFLGMFVDPQFGPVVQVGLGGIFVEVMRDVVHLMPPFDADQLEERLDSLRGRALLAGARGRPPVDMKALLDAACRFGDLCAAVGPAFAALEVNPLMAGPGDCLAVDVVAITGSVGNGSAMARPVAARPGSR